ncbi:hypothetical protein lerEdw1_009832 [Lerista edwardsae]|nr:hypothetical protein lerEdw1_009832 [Lerista edwardsae]
MCPNYSAASLAPPPWGLKSSPDMGNTSWWGKYPRGEGPCRLSPASATQKVWLYGSVLLLGLATHSVMLWALLQKVHLGNILAVSLLSLAVSDLLYLSTLPLWTVYVLRGHRWPFGGPACHLAGFLFYSNMYVSVFLLCAVSLERYLAVAHPLRCLGLCSCRSALLTCSSVVMLVFLAILLTLEVQQPGSWYNHYPLQPGVATFNYVRVALGFGLPLLVLGVSYLKIVQGV